MLGIRNKEDKHLFMILLLLLTITAIFLALGLLFILSYSGIYLYKTLITILAIILLSIVIYLFLLYIFINKILNGKKLLSINITMIHKSIRFIYPIMIGISNITKIEKDSIRRVFSLINNRIVSLNGVKLNNKDILVITPHCLQKTICKHKITGDINNCVKCGACDIKDLINVCEKYNVNLEVVTGGTLARKIIKDYKPKGIIAIACERDLVHGILDVSSIPVLGVTNDRPEGPCKNTCVDINKVENAIKKFLGRS